MVRRSISNPLVPQEAPPELESIREELYASLPTIHLPELMMVMDSEIRFSWILLGREPANEQELLYVYAALLGHAMDVTAQRSSPMTRGLSASGLTSALQLGGRSDDAPNAFQSAEQSVA